MRTWLLMVAMLAGSCALVGGCASEAPTPRGLGESIETGARVLRASDMFPEDRASWRTAILDPDSGEVTRVEVSSRQIRGDGSWTVLTVAEGTDTSPDAGEMVYERREDGAVALVSLVAEAPRALNRERARYFFEPPLAMAASELGVGETFEETCDVRIVALADEDRVIQRGTATRRLELIGAQSYELPAGEVMCLRAHAVFEMTLGRTNVVNESDVWVEPGGGTVGESGTRVVRLLGVVVQRERLMSRAAREGG